MAYPMESPFRPRQLWKVTNWLGSERDETLDKFDRGPKHFSRDYSTTDLSLEPGNRLIPIDTDNSV